MSKKRRQHSAQFKAQVGLDALKGIEPVHAIAAKRGVHPVQVSQWKKEAADMRAYFEQYGARMPGDMLEELKGLESRLG